MSAKALGEIRGAVERCRSTDSPGCIHLTEYRDRASVEGANHPVLFQVVPNARVMLIGAVPGGIDTDVKKAAYQALVRGQFSLGHKSAQGLGEIMRRVGEIRGIDLPGGLTSLPHSNSIQENHLRARERLGLHVTNLVKCHAPTAWERTDTALWKQTADACASRHLTYEIETVDPEMVIFLGKHAADYVSQRESWGLEGNKLKISAWAEQAGYRPCYGKPRFVTAWVHPGGRYFRAQGRGHWDLYARQMAEFVD